MKKINFILTLFFIFSSCSKSGSSDSSASIIPEQDLCNTNTTYSSFSILTGTARFSKRTLDVGKLGSDTNQYVNQLILSDSVISSPLPIRYAEVIVKNGSGQVVQCGKTNSSGQLKALDGTSDLKIPDTAGTYTVQVMARAHHTMSVAAEKSNPFTAFFSVKEDIYSNKVHSISSTVITTSASTYSVSNLTATAKESEDSSIPGGAFNIYNNIITTFDYLAYNTGATSLSCLDSKFDVYWKAGFNPNQYVYPEYSPGQLGTISFYLRSENEIYLSGGRMGNVTSEDTDHFDDSVIIHELGHHIENVCGRMDSPGGSHSGNSRIDPRLAWSEGWGNYLSAHIIKNKINNINPDLSAQLPASGWLFYYDSDGYGSVEGYENIRFNLARPGNSTSEPLKTRYGSGSYSFDPVDFTNNPGESHFREVSISRGLFKATNTCLAPYANCANEDNFPTLWSAFNRFTGIGKSIYPFKNSVRLIERFKDAYPGGSLSSALNTIFNSDEALQPFNDASYQSGGYPNWVAYGTKLVPNGSACPIRIKPRWYYTANAYKNDQRFSNHFFHVDKNVLNSVSEIQITTSNISGTPNLTTDLILFNENYKYNEDCRTDGDGYLIGCSKTSSSYAATSNRSSSNPKSISIASISGSANYLLNIRVYLTGSIASDTEYEYQLRDQNGGYLCPDTNY